MTRIQTLSDLQPCQSATVRSVCAPDGMQRRLRDLGLIKWGRQHQDRELTEQDMAVDYETTYWLLDRGWSNDEAAFCGGEH